MINLDPSSLFDKFSYTEDINKPLISIIIQNHNTGKYIKESIESVLSQRYRSIENNEDTTCK